MTGIVLMHAAVLWALTSGWRAPIKESVTVVDIRLDITPQVHSQDKRALVTAALATSVRLSANLTQTTRQDERPQTAPIDAPTPVTTAVLTAQLAAEPIEKAGASSTSPSSSEQASPGPPMASPVARATAAPPQVQLPSSDAEYLNNAKPIYPPLSKRLGEHGHVLVRTLIGVDGVAQRSEIARSSGFERLDKSALESVMKWRYVPGKRAGVPEAMWFNVPLRFVLE